MTEHLARLDNPAVDEALLEALALGEEDEKEAALALLIRRAKATGLLGLLRRYERLSTPLQEKIQQASEVMRPVVRSASKAGDIALRVSAMRYITQVGDIELADAAVTNIGGRSEGLSQTAAKALLKLVDRATPEQRPAIEQAVADALDQPGGTSSPDLVRRALSLADHPDSPILAILDTPRHRAHAVIVRRIQDPPAPGGAAAMCLAAARHRLGNHFGVSVGSTEKHPALADLAVQHHRLRDRRVELAASRARRGIWFDAESLMSFVRRRPDTACGVVDWIVAGKGVPTDRDKLLLALVRNFPDDRALRLAALRATPTLERHHTLLALLDSTDEPIARMALRQLVARNIDGLHGILLRRLPGAPGTLRTAISRIVGRESFAGFWERFDALAPADRKTAGQALVKVMPDALDRLDRVLRTGSVAARLKALQVADELNVTHELKPTLDFLCRDPRSKIRSKAVLLLGRIADGGGPVMRALGDDDPRVRANAVDALRLRLIERRNGGPRVADLLRRRADVAENRERANAAAALHVLNEVDAGALLQRMLQDDRPTHRISALWAVRQTTSSATLPTVADLARTDAEPKVRKAALATLRLAAARMRTRKAVAA
ncbi:MAG: HEAT repeat domain-containing protein [Planctomycetota bacterium]